MGKVQGKFFKDNTNYQTDLQTSVKYNARHKAKNTLYNLKDKLWSKNSVDEVKNQTDLAEYQVGDAQDKRENIPKFGT